MFNFTDQIVLVTGASGNLGGATPRAFAAAGAVLVLPDRKHTELDDVVPDLPARGRHMLITDINLADGQDVTRLIAETLKRHGRIDVLAHTVGAYRADGPPHETSEHTWDFMLSVNARTTFLINRAVAPAMIGGGGGKIINTASRSTFGGGANDVAYAAAKSAVARITESMAAAYKKQRINVNAVVPGTIDTPENREAMPKANPERWVTPEAIAQVILFLASPVAAPIHGALIPVYGLS